MEDCYNPTGTVPTACSPNKEKQENNTGIIRERTLTPDDTRE